MTDDKVREFPMSDFQCPMSNYLHIPARPKVGPERMKNEELRMKSWELHFVQKSPLSLMTYDQFQ
jgi:hypothetical protein